MALLKHALSQLREELGKSNRDEIIEGSRLNFEVLANRFEERRLIPPQYAGDRKIAGLRSWKVLRGYLVPLRDHFGRQKVTAITYHDIEQYKLTRLATPKQRGGKPRTITNVNRELELLRSIFIYAKQEGWIERSPFDRGGLISKADEVHRDRILSFEEEKRLLDACGSGKRGHLRPLLICALDTGMRRGEILSLRWSDVNLESKTIRIKALNTKTLTARSVPITNRLARELETLSQVVVNQDNPIFSLIDTRKSFRNACAEAGISGLRFHDLRATTASRLIAAGMPLEEVAKMLGHTVLNTTFKHYTRVDEVTVRKAANLLNQINYRNTNG